ncbi:intraflagellar transport protein 25 homolog isoform X2 [Saimiri boliviensis]
MRKTELCLSSEGSEVILATSSDEKHPPENIIDGNPDTFWTTTGMFPQEFIICFHKHVRIERLVIQSYFVRTLKIEKSTSKEPVDFEQWIEKDLVHTEGQLQNEEIMHIALLSSLSGIPLCRGHMWGGILCGLHLLGNVPAALCNLTPIESLLGDNVWQCTSEFLTCI